MAKHITRIVKQLATGVIGQVLDTDRWRIRDWKD